MPERSFVTESLRQAAPGHNTPELLPVHVARNRQQRNRQVHRGHPEEDGSRTKPLVQPVDVRGRQERQHRLGEIDRDEGLVRVFLVAIDHVGQRCLRGEGDGGRMQGHEDEDRSDG